MNCIHARGIFGLSKRWITVNLLQLPIILGEHCSLFGRKGGRPALGFASHRNGNGRHPKLQPRDRASIIAWLAGAAHFGSNVIDGAGCRLADDAGQRGAPRSGPRHAR